MCLPSGIDLPEKDFDKLLLEAVDEGLASLGESSKQAIYYHLEKAFNVKKHEIPYKIEDFTRAVEKIFGLGASVLQLLIMKVLYEKVGRAVQLHEPKDFTFTNYVAAVKRSFLEKKEAEAPVQCEQIEAES